MSRFRLIKYYKLENGKNASNNTNISKNPKYVGKEYETNIDGVVREIYEKEDGIEVYVTYEVLEDIGTNEKIVF